LNREGAEAAKTTFNPEAAETVQRRVRRERRDLYWLCVLRGLCV
jgi:hypothetical protein